jgi:hypothetical protein
LLWSCTGSSFKWLLRLRNRFGNWIILSSLLFLFLGNLFWNSLLWSFIYYWWRNLILLNFNLMFFIMMRLALIGVNGNIL